MKKLCLITTLILVCSAIFGQSLQKGNLVGVHNLTITLDPDVTMNQYKTFYLNKVIPEYEKHFTGVNVYLLKGIRGENVNSLGIMWVFESEEDRNKYFDEDGSTTELANSTFEKIQPITDELEKLGTWSSDYTDWLVQ
jgi:hypothetical protein